MAIDKREEENTIPKKKAIVIGVSDYNTNLQPLNFCKKDGIEMCELLTSLGYEISDDHRLIGHVGFNQMREAIYDFFDNSSALGNQTLLLYFSGHGVPTDGDMCLASSEINPDEPYRKGFSSYELTRLMQDSVSLRVVTILDCCYSGAAKLSKGHEDDAAKIATDALRSKARILQGEQQGEGKCLLAASQAAQEAYGLKKQEHSIFTYYLLEGLRGNERSVDTNGNVTPYSLGSYVYKAILNLPPKKRPKQKPVTKVEASGDIILAEYPELAKRDSSAILTPISSSGLLFYSLSPQQMSPPVQQEHLSSRSPVSSRYYLDDVGRKTKREQNIAAPIRPKVEEKKQLLNNSKVMMLIAAVVSSIVAFIVVGAIQIQPQNHLPSAIDESVTTEMNTPVNTTLKGRDLDENNIITAAILRHPYHGTLGNINQVSGVVTYIPNQNFAGNDSFTYNVNDGKIDSNNIALVKIRVGVR